VSFPPTTPIQLPGLIRDDRWYQKSIFYELLVGSFADSNGDGTGDLQGITDRLDYLQWLGVDCLWLPPFFESPMRDGGYDVADYRRIKAEYGNLDDFRRLVASAHQRNMRILIDLPLNHTSDQHPWFQASRSDPDGPYGDYYVWRDTDDGYPDARIIFSDYESSNWAFDDERRQFYWHRFYSHQPDLNYENPAVQAEAIDVVRYWLAQGVDGFRLDAIPYLFEEEGTDCAGVPATHGFLAQLREIVDREFPGRMMIAEANQWPDEVAEYFGTDERPECQMAFDFPTMPRIFYALRSHDARELERVLAMQTDIPAGAAWGVFLRNHDELSLEMVDEAYRQAMYGWYAYDPRMRVNLGIRRRLASLLDNSRAELELSHALLLSLPGSPFLYYGDEIGMGDNIWLDDRDASRTPMQWTPDRDAGFSSADPGKLIHPVVQSLVFNYVAKNVERERAQSQSLLNWVRGMIMQRKLHPAFSLGDCRVVESDHPGVVAFVRSVDSRSDGYRTRPDAVLCVYNFAITAVSVHLHDADLAGRDLHDIFGGEGFPAFDDAGDLELTLGAQDFYWLGIESPRAV
jgi:maltose alpha-D-glucosyltransferase/alpha-amylase